MEPRFTRGEYFLLEIVVEYEWSISGLIDNELELHLNFIVPLRFPGTGGNRFSLEVLRYLL